MAGMRANHSDVRRESPYAVGEPAGAVAGVAAPPLALGRGLREPAPPRDLRDVLQPFLAVAGRYLDSLLARPALPAHTTPAAAAPEVYVGDPESGFAPRGVLSDEELQRHGRGAVLVYVTDATSAWIAEVEAAARAAGADHVLCVTLDRSEYPVTQTSWRGSKAIDLGTGLRVPVPWLTSLDQSVEVLHWSAALYGPGGRFVRGGAEGFHALRTPFKESILGSQRTLTGDSFAAAVAARRDDLAGAPLAWQVALRNLVGQLAGRPEPLVPAAPPD
jgi:hypothetical protein